MPRGWMPTGELSQQDEAALNAHYGLDHGEGRSDSGLPEGAQGGRRESVGRDVSGPETDDAMTRSEEELRVGTAKREAGRARLVKHVVTEDVTRTVPVQREEVRVEREPITDADRGDAMGGGDITEEEHEVVLHEEEVVVDKQAVPKERVRLDKDVVTDEHQVSETVRKEQIETDGMPRPPLAQRPEVAGRDGRPPPLCPHHPSQRGTSRVTHVRGRRHRRRRFSRRWTRSSPSSHAYSAS